MSSTEPPAPTQPPIFVVTAYRHGQLNNHTYTVHVGTDRQAAIAAASDENSGRGLKYGVEVVEYPSEQAVAYFSSSAEARDATAPAESAERNAAQAIGTRLLLAYQARTRKTPLDLLIVEKLAMPELPDWLDELCRTELDLALRMQAHTSRPSTGDE